MYVEPFNNRTTVARDLYIRESLVELVSYAVNIVLYLNFFNSINVVSVHYCKVGRNAAWQEAVFVVCTKYNPMA